MKTTSSRERPGFLARTMARPVFWAGVALTVLLLDWFAGATISFPFVFVFPVALAAWHRGFRWGALFAVGLPLVRFGFNVLRDTPWPVPVSGINLGIRMLVLVGFAWLIARAVAQRRHIETLERLLPICAWCGKIRNREEGWLRLDAYLARRTDLTFTHTICQECAAKHLAAETEKGS